MKIVDYQKLADEINGHMEPVYSELGKSDVCPFSDAQLDMLKKIVEMTAVVAIRHYNKLPDAD